MRLVLLVVILAFLPGGLFLVLRDDLTFMDVLQAQEDMDEKCGADLDDSLNDAFDAWWDATEPSDATTTDDPDFRQFLARQEDWITARCECAEAQQIYASLSATFSALFPSSGSSTPVTSTPPTSDPPSVSCGSSEDGQSTTVVHPPPETQRGPGDSDGDIDGEGDSNMDSQHTVISAAVAWRASLFSASRFAVVVSVVASLVTS